MLKINLLKRDKARKSKALFVFVNVLYYTCTCYDTNRNKLYVNAGYCISALSAVQIAVSFTVDIEKKKFCISTSLPSNSDIFRYCPTPKRGKTAYEHPVGYHTTIACT